MHWHLHSLTGLNTDPAGHGGHGGHLPELKIIKHYRLFLLYQNEAITLYLSDCFFLIRYSAHKNSSDNE